MGLPHIDFKKRKENHTERALALVKSIDQVTPILLEIHYPSFYAGSPPSFYLVERCYAVPISRLKSVTANYILKLCYMPNGEAIFLWK